MNPQLERKVKELRKSGLDDNKIIDSLADMGFDVQLSEIAEQKQSVSAKAVNGYEPDVQEALDFARECLEKFQESVTMLKDIKKEKRLNFSRETNVFRQVRSIDGLLK